MPRYPATVVRASPRHLASDGFVLAWLSTCSWPMSRFLETSSSESTATNTDASPFVTLMAGGSMCVEVYATKSGSPAATRAG